MNEVLPRIVLCLPGPWASLADLEALLANSPSGACQVLGADRLRFHDDCLEFEWRPFEPRLVDAFRCAAGCRPSVDTSVLDRIAEHKSVVYAVSPSVPRNHAAQWATKMLLLGAEFLDAGSLAVKIESSSLAHSADAWRSLVGRTVEGLSDANRPDAGEDERLAARYDSWIALYDAYVVPLIGDEGDYYSCGMHLLGKRDVTLSRLEAPHVALSVIDDFSAYLLAESKVEEGHTFRRNEGDTRRTITSEPCARYDHDDFFFNPYGYWRLSPC